MYFFICTIFSSTSWLEFPPTLGLSWGINARHLFNFLVALFYIFRQKVETISLSLMVITFYRKCQMFSLFSLSNLTPIVLISTVGVGQILSRFPINRSPGQKVGNTKRMIYFLVISIQFSCVHAMHIITIVAIVIYQGRKHVLSL